MRFCTSRPFTTMTASTRLSDSGRNSIWLSDCCACRGIVTTPARCVIEDSTCEATATSASGILRMLIVQAPAQLVDRVVRRVDVPASQQRIDEEPVTLVGGHAAGRGVRRGDEAVLLEVRHHVAHGGGAEIQSRVARQRPRADGLTLADIALHQHREQVPGAVVELLVCGIRRHVQATVPQGLFRGSFHAR